MKKYINGYDKFKIRTVDSSNNETEYNFTFRYQALTEYYEKISIVHRDIGGTMRKKVKRIDYEWRISYTDAIEREDILKFGKIEDAEREGQRIYLMPHIDYPWREFEVLIMDEKRTIGMMTHGRGRDTTMNYGYEISFTNRWTITNIQMADPNYIPVISAMVYEEF